jgi:signal transduction histidine kinase
MRIPRTISGFSLKKALITFIIAVGLIADSYSQDTHVIDSLENVIRNAKEDTSLVNSLTALSLNYMMISSFNKSVLYVDSAIALSEKLKFIPGQANAHGQKGRLLIDMGNYPAALENMKLSLKYAEITGNKNKIAGAYDNIGTIHHYLGDQAEALQNCMIAKRLYEETGDKKGISSNFMNLGKTYLALNKYTEAAEMFYNAIKIKEEIGDKNGMAATYNNLGTMYLEQDKYTEALKMYHEALLIYEEAGYKTGILFNYNNIGRILSEQGKYNEGKEMFILALKISEEIGDTISIIDLNNNIGYIYKLMEKYEEAEVYFNFSLELAYKIGYYEEGITNTHDYLATLFASQDKFEEAERHFLTALEFYKKSGDKFRISRQYNRLGSLFFYSGDFQKAREYVLEGLPTFRELSSIKGLLYTYKFLYKIDSAEGRFSGALENYKLFTLYSDSLLSEESRQSIEKMKIEYETEKKDQEIELLNKDNEIKSLQLSKQKAIRHGMIAGIILLFITGFLLFRSFRLRKKLEQQQAIISERRRISADLHDDVGSGLSRIMLLTELVKNEAKTPEMQREAEKIAAISKELSANISEIIWALNANNDYLESLVAYIRRYAAEFFDDSAVNIKITSTGEIAGIPISGELRREIFYTVKEALHNIYKHSRATEAKLGFAINDELLTITIQDNGVGIPEKETGRYGNGLNNMRQRMEAVRGQIQIENHVGTKIKLEVPVR